MNKFASIDNLVACNQETLLNIPSIGPKISESITEYFSEFDNLNVLEKLRSAGVNMISKTVTPSEGIPLLSDLRFVVTGRLENYSRTEIQDLIKRYGGKVSSSVSKSTDYLLAGQDGGSKLSEATKLGVQIISESDFDILTVGK